MKDNNMLRRGGLLVLLLFFCLIIQSKGVTLVGRVSNPTIKQLYVFSVYDEQNVYLLPLDSIRVVDQGFNYHNDTLKSQLLFITPVSEKKDIEAAFLQGCYIFPSNGMNDFAFSLSATKGIKVESSSSPFQTLYEQFVKERDRVGQKQLLDSLDQVFYAAREKNDSRERLISSCECNVAKICSNMVWSYWLVYRYFRRIGNNIITNKPKRIR